MAFYSSGCVMIGAVESELAPRGELALDSVQRGAVGGEEHCLDRVSRAPPPDASAVMPGEVVADKRRPSRQANGHAML